MSLLDLVWALVGSIGNIVTYPIIGLWNVITYNLLYLFNMILSIIGHILDEFTLIYNLGTNFFTAVYDSRLAIMLTGMLWFVLVLRVYSVVHGKTFSVAILGNEIGFTFP